MSHQQPISIHGGWQSHRDFEKRRKMIQFIFLILQKDDHSELHQWLNGLPVMVQQLEAALYRSAPSLEAYADASTLRHRLKLLAVEIAKKTSPLDIILTEPRTTASDDDNTSHETAKDLEKKQQRLLLLYHASQCPHGDGKCPRSKQCTEYKHLWHHISHCVHDKCDRPSSCISSRSLLSHFRSCENTECELCRPLRQKFLSGK